MLAASGPAHAGDFVTGGKLLLTRGVTAIEGGTGAGLSTWALIAGNETKDGVGATAFATGVPMSDFAFAAYGGAVGVKDRLEISLARQSFDTGRTGAALGLGEDFTFRQTILGAKLKVAGDAVYDQDRWLPQIAVGVQYKTAEQDGVLAALGARDDDGVDVYAAATKVLLGQSLVLNGTLRLTKANQFGLLGFGGDARRGYSAQFEGTAGYLLTDKLLLAGEYRTKPDNLGFAREEDVWDVFAAYAVNHHVSLVAGYVDLGAVATFENQRGAYLSLQIGF